MKTEVSENLIKVRSLVNGDVYYTSKNFPVKEIDGNQYIRVVRNLQDNRMLFMNKEKIEFIRG